MIRKRRKINNEESSSKKVKKESSSNKIKKISLLENFISIQGEGHTQGKVCVFLRFKHCNLIDKCYICDTALRMKTTPESEYNIEDIIEQGKFSNYNFVITGGEPTLTKYHDQILSFIDSFAKYCKKNKIEPGMVLFETNGFHIVELLEKIRDIVSKSWFEKYIHVVYSPKNYIIREGHISNEDVVTEIENKIIDVIKLGVNIDNLCLKMVAFDKSTKYAKTFTIINMLLERNKIPKKIIYIMPEGISKEELLTNNKQIYEYCIMNGINFSTRIHIMHNMY